MREITIMFRGLLSVIFIGNFYQFLPVIGYLFQDKICIKKDYYYSKILQKSFNAIITLTQAMRQINDPKFNVLLRQAYASTLTDANITNLISKIATNFLLYDLPKNMVIVQKNKTRHIIN